MSSSARSLKLRLVPLVLGIYVPLWLAFALVTHAHDYFLSVRRFRALPVITEHFAFSVMGAGPRGHDDLLAPHSWVFYLFWLPLYAAPLTVAIAVARSGGDRARLMEIAFQCVLAYVLAATSLFLLLLIGIVAPFL